MFKEGGTPFRLSKSFSFDNSGPGCLKSCEFYHFSARNVPNLREKNWTYGLQIMHNVPDCSFYPIFTIYFPTFRSGGRGARHRGACGAVGF
ncbi:hypothetical protein DCCM_0883 [Desulfocucumis palustris]|uniref:Uncharacterized protein n=1 Tax=Desulfocucumis palustris TaxID=1898651 RepID=A0A2L2X8X6_9FIRM|nr:hypothetical protein DCCM_0883 [Desulfocucumis palustris]